MINTYDKILIPVGSAVGAVMKYLFVVLLLMSELCSGAEILPAYDLALQSSEAQAEGKIFVRYISRPGCPYCARLEKSVLHPMLKMPEYTARVSLRELSWVEGAIRDFDGDARYIGKIVKRYGIVTTPTLLFLNPEGREIAERLVGFTGDDFYFSYLAHSVHLARQKVGLP